MEVESLAKMINVSQMTVRRDINYLCELGQLERCRGGARLPQDTVIETSYDIKKGQHLAEKRQIARKAMQLIREGDTVYLDSGTTTGEIALEICRTQMPVSVVTNDLSIALLLSESEADVTILGGSVQKTTKSVIGHASEDVLRQYRFSKAFLGASSIDYEFNTFSPTYDKAYLKRMVIEQTQKPYLVTDSSKFYCQALCLVASLNQFAGVITDKVFSDDEQKLISEMNVEIIPVEEPK